MNKGAFDEIKLRFSKKDMSFIPKDGKKRRRLLERVALVALAALAELHPVRTLSARTPARSIRFLSFFISIPSSLSIIGISCLTCFALAQYTLVLGKSKLPT